MGIVDQDMLETIRPSRSAPGLPDGVTQEVALIASLRLGEHPLVSAVDRGELPFQRGVGVLLREARRPGLRNPRR